MTVTDSVQSNSISGFSSSLSSKYESIIEVPVSKEVHRSLFKIFNYFDNHAVKIPFLINVISLIRFMQLVAPSLMVSDPIFYDQNDLCFKTCSLFSIVAHLLPATKRNGEAVIFLLAYIFISLVYIILLVYFAMSYQKTAHIQMAAVNILSISTVFFAFLLLPASGQMVSEICSDMIAGIRKANTLLITVVILSFALFVTLSYILMYIFTQTLIFRPCSLITVESRPQADIIMVTVFVTVIIALVKSLNKWITLAAMVISIILYVIPIYDLYKRCSCILEIHQKLVLSGCLIGILNLLVKIILLILDLKMTVHYIFAYIAIALVSFITSDILIKKKVAKQLNLLDQYEETKNLDHINSPQMFCSIITPGFTYVHPSCLSYDIFNCAVSKWENSIEVWNIFAKFASIYPENVSMLIFVSNNVIKNRFKGDIAETIVTDIKTILKSRETNLNAEVKRSINKCLKLIEKSKNRLRNIWDLVLQNNYAEIEHSVHAAYEAVETAKREINHVLMLYPNNRFVSKLYARFLRDVMADKVNAKKWMENTITLQRGGRIAPDTIHDLALSVFPELPQRISEMNTTNLVGTINDDQSEFGDIFDDSEFDEIEGESFLMSIIEKHRVPAIKKTVLMFTLFLLFIVILPSVVLLAMFGHISFEMLDPLPIMLGISNLRCMLNLEAALTAMFVMTNVEDPKQPGRTMMQEHNIPESMKMKSFGGYRNMKDICNYILKILVLTPVSINPIKTYKLNNKKLDEARDAIVQNTLEYYITRSPTDIDKVIISMDTYVGYYSTQISKIISEENITDDVVKGVAFRTVMGNYDNPSVKCNEALRLIIEYLQEINAINQKTFLFIMIGLILLSVLTYFIIIYIQHKSLKDDKKEIFTSLSYLPKTVVSTISQSFCTLRKTDETTSVAALKTNEVEKAEMNKQEENIIKVFNSISDSSGSNNVEYITSFILLLVVVLGCLCYYFLCSTYREMNTKLIESAPQLDYLLGTYSRMCSVFATLLTMVFQSYNPEYEFYTDTNQRIRFGIIKLKDLEKFFAMSRFGGSSSDEFPFAGMDESLKYADTIIVCDDPVKPPTEFLEAMSCFDAEGQIYLISTYITKLFSTMPDTFPRPREDLVSRLFYCGPLFLSDSFFSPSSSNIVPTITDQITSKLAPLILKIVLTLLASIILIIVNVLVALNEEKYLKFMLKMFLFCGNKTVFQSTKVTKLLNGTYKDDSDEKTNRDAEFYDNVADKLAEVIVIVNSADNTILSVNTSFQKVFGVKEEDVVKTNVINFFSKDCFCGNISNLLKEKTQIVYTFNGNEKKYYDFTVTTVANSIIISGRDQTLRINHENLIAEEKKKSDQMLASILPPSLVPRVQAGEKNISFSVQSVSVLFLDIVEFTPWCGSNQPQYVMKMLNTIFKEMDALTSLHRSVTRIKCIGDCYMAAGGIFDEVNQPEIHAKETVEFGCEAIRKITEIDNICNEKLRIRVGVNTGGPVVVGVLGTNKPTFEILGPTINIAQQMEHHGVPMNVHISRSVYELIYGGSFNVKERGEIDVKRGKMFTYLVSP